MGWISNKTSRKALKPGDHIYSWRSCYVYSHHGIYVGEEQVIHFTSRDQESIIYSCSVPKSGNPCKKCGHKPKDRSVIKSCLDCFLNGGDPYLFEYGVSKAFFLAKVRGGVCTLAKADTPKETLRRATYLLEYGFGAYDVFKNNCEDFAIYCKTGLVALSSYKVGGTSGQATTFCAAFKSVWSLPVGYCLFNLSGMGALSCGVYCRNRLVSDLGYRHDVMKDADVKKIGVIRFLLLCKLSEMLILVPGWIIDLWWAWLFLLKLLLWVGVKRFLLLCKLSEMLILVLGWIIYLLRVGLSIYCICCFKLHEF